MGSYHKVLSLQLAAAVANGISVSQTKAGAGALTITGSLAAGGVATMDVPRRVAITSGGSDESGKNFTITGTARSDGRALTRTLAGPGAGLTVFTNADFLTISSVTVDAALTGNVTVGTNAVGSTAPIVIDRFINPATLSAMLAVGAGNTNQVEVSYDELSPAWDVDTVTPTWKEVDVANNEIKGPVTMVRLTQSVGTALSKLTVITPLLAGRV